MGIVSIIMLNYSSQRLSEYKFVYVIFLTDLSSSNNYSNYLLFHSPLFFSLIVAKKFCFKVFSGKDQLLPSQKEAERLKKILPICDIRCFNDSGHALFLVW